MNTELRKEASNEFDKNLCKLLNNSVFGQFLENVCLHENVELVSDARAFLKSVSKLLSESFKIVNDSTVLIDRLQTSVVLNKPLGEHYSETPFDMNAGLRLMYIYPAIASYSSAGDTKTPLQKIVNVDSSSRKTTRVTLSRPNFIPVARRDIETIEFNMSNELGLPMPFEYGKSVITLHFRRRHSFLE